MDILIFVSIVFVSMAIGRVAKLLKDISITLKNIENKMPKNGE
jgi:hypothetical protein